MNVPVYVEAIIMFSFKHLTRLYYLVYPKFEFCFIPYTTWEDELYLLS